MRSGPVRDELGSLFSRFTGRARQSLALAEQAARALGHDHVGPEHVLLGILNEGSNLAVKVLTTLDVELEDLAAELVASMAPAEQQPEGQIPLGHNYIGCEHLLLGLIAVEDGLASQVLRQMGIEHRTTRRAVVTALTGLSTPSRMRPGRAHQKATLSSRSFAASTRSKNA